MKLRKSFDAFLSQIDIKDTRRERIVTAHNTIRDLLLSDENIKQYSPSFFLQGSYAMRTIVRPSANEDYDVDLVLCLLLEDAAGNMLSGDVVKSMVYDAIASHGTYKDKVSMKTHCIRIDYEGDFHLDITPAHRTNGDDDTILVVPDWSESNPKGLIAYFRDVHSKAYDKFYPVVRMLKWWRNIHFGDEGYPKSILLTTLASRYIPSKDVSLDSALCTVLEGIHEYVKDLEEAPEVLNPVNENENLCRNWTKDDFLSFKSKISVAAFAAREALDCKDEEKTISIWNDKSLFDDTFPKAIYHIADEPNMMTKSFVANAAGVTSSGAVELRASSEANRTQSTNFWRSSGSAHYKRFFSQKAIKSNVQEAALRSRYSSFRKVSRGDGSFSYFITVKPREKEYTLEIKYDYRNTPVVYVSSLELDGECPHLNPDGSLCLFKPSEYKWNHQKLIADTIVKWSSFWLYYYEWWIETNVWLGPEAEH